MAKYLLTKYAEGDLIDIAEYTFEEWGERNWNEYQGLLEEAFLYLAEHPEQGIYREEIGTGVKSFLERKKKRHLIFYRIVESNIQILRVLHHSMDIQLSFDEINLNDL